MKDFEPVGSQGLRVYDQTIAPAALNRALVLTGVAVSSLTLGGKTLEDHFLDITAQEGDHA
jgi:hypothetical protein